jgi:hypothetical protein
MRASRQNEHFGVPVPKEVYNYRVYLLALVSSMGAFMFGYDIGFVGTAIVLPPFVRLALLASPMYLHQGLTVGCDTETLG